MAADSPSSHRATVLVAEDDHTLRELLVMMLEDEGYRVVEAADGLEGLSP
jgi:CheY-like chemotaxis protein